MIGSKEVVLKANEMVFQEGDQSKNLYFIKRGVVRIFKKKGAGAIEIETIRAGQILGELAFFDNQPRSASAEALTQVELVEISKVALDDAIAKVPEWFSALVKSITARLRTTTNRLRALESVSTDYEVDKFGNRSREFTYVNTSEILRFSTALLTVAARYGKQNPAAGIDVSQPLLERFSQILQVNSNKVQSLIETYKSVNILSPEMALLDIRFLDQLIQFLNEQNMVEPSKKRVLTEPGFTILDLIAKNKNTAVKVSDTSEKVNIAPFLEGAGVTLNQVQELYDQGFVQSITMVSGSETQVQYDINKLNLEHRVFWLLSEISKLNEIKRKSSS